MLASNLQGMQMLVLVEALCDYAVDVTEREYTLSVSRRRRCTAAKAQTESGPLLIRTVQRCSRRGKTAAYSLDAPRIVR